MGDGARRQGGRKQGDQQVAVGARGHRRVLLYSSSALSFSVDDFGTCGGRRAAGVCKGSGEFCQRIRASGAVSLAAAVALADLQVPEGRAGGHGMVQG